MENIELKKHSGLIAMSNRNITVPQRKLYNALLYLSAKQMQEDPMKRIFKLRFADVVKFSGYNEFTNTKYLKESIRNLVETVVEYNILGKDKKNEWGVFAVLSQATIKEFQEYITVEFPSIILDNISVPNIYALLNLSIVNSLSGKYSLPLYELLVDYKKIRNLTIPIMKFKEMLGIDNADYNKISNFRNRIVNPAIDEINSATDLNVEYELERIDSRSYTHITFSIKDKYADLNPIESSAYHLLKSKGLQDATAKKFAKQLSKQNILEAIEHLEKAIKRGSVKNVAAYLTRMLKNVDIDDEDVVELLPQPELFSKSKNEQVNLINTKLFKEYTKNKICEIVRSLTVDEINIFIQSQNDFGIEHLCEKGLIDHNKNIINMTGLTQNIVFLGWVENRYFDRKIEYKLFSNINDAENEYKKGI